MGSWSTARAARGGGTRVRLAGLIIAALLSSSNSPAMAGEPASLRDFLFPSHDKPTLEKGRYAPSDGEAFIVDHLNSKDLLLRFEDSQEIWALKPTAGPRGDVIYKTDTGEPMLRATRLGGLTLFTGERPNGAAAAYMGEGATLRPPVIPNPSVLFQILIQASLRASRATQHLVVFEAQDLTPHDLTPASSAVLADTAINTAEAFNKIAGRNGQGRPVVTRFNRVQFTTGKDVAIRINGSVVQITVVADKGYAGRPSSARIMSVLQKK